MKCYVKSCIADFGADAKSSIKCNTLIMEIKITQQLHSLPRCRALRQNRSRRERETDNAIESQKSYGRKQPAFFSCVALIQSLYSQDKQLKMCVYEFPGIRESKMPQPYTQLGDIYRNLETFKKQSKQLPPHKKKKKQATKHPHPPPPPPNQKNHDQNHPLAWYDDMYWFFQVGKQPSTVFSYGGLECKFSMLAQKMTWFWMVLLLCNSSLLLSFVCLLPICNLRL